MAADGSTGLWRVRPEDDAGEGRALDWRATGRCVTIASGY